MDIDETMFELLAPYFQDGNYIEFSTGSREFFRYYFKNGKCHYQEGQIVYPEID